MMRNLPTYEQFNEQYLPYFGSKQALDDSIKPTVKNEAHSTSELHRRYSMTPTWWAAWRLENEKEKGLKIDKDAFSKTYEVKDKNDKVLFVFDYARNIIFTNMAPSDFMLKDEITSKEMADIHDKADKIKDDLAGVDPKKGDGKETKKEEEAEGEVDTDNVEASEEE